MKNKWFEVIEFNGISCKRSKVVNVMHGERLVGKNYVAILSGKLCDNSRYSPPTCNWCYSLMKRIRSRREY